MVSFTLNLIKCSITLFFNHSIMLRTSWAWECVSLWLEEPLHMFLGWHLIFYLKSLTFHKNRDMFTTEFLRGKKVYLAFNKHSITTCLLTDYHVFNKLETNSVELVFPKLQHVVMIGTIKITFRMEKNCTWITVYIWLLILLSNTRSLLRNTEFDSNN